MPDTILRCEQCGRRLGDDDDVIQARKIIRFRTLGGGVVEQGPAGWFWFHPTHFPRSTMPARNELAENQIYEEVDGGPLREVLARE